MAITIAKQPSSIAAIVGDSITFTVVATGVSAYRWQYNPGNKWYDLTDWETADTASLTFATTATRMTWQYRCKLTDDNGSIVYTDAVWIVDDDRGLIARETLTAIADAIRAKTETTDSVFPDDMAALIEGISGLPDELEEFEVVEFTPASSLSKAPLTIPCSMSAVPDSFLITYARKVSSNISSGRLQIFAYGSLDKWWVMRGNGTDYGTELETYALVDGVLTIYPGLTNQMYSTTVIYHCCMWRRRV